MSTPKPMNKYVKRLTRLASAYRAAEAAVVRAFFGKPRPKKDHLRWLKAQGFKEYSAIKPIIDALTALYPHVGRSVARHDYTELTEKLADETKHARLVMDLLEEITGKKITPRDLTWLPQDRRLARVRAKYSKSYAGLLHGSQKITSKEIIRSDEELERAAITLTEGGGGALYQICSRLKKRGFEGKIARVFHEILRDEVEHKDSGARSLQKLICDQAAFRRAAKIIADISAQRLRMRNEQFGFPLNRGELAALEDRARQSIP
ncbi:MAG: ferritin-like domain-containing protein [Candidatus Binatia bacterium]